MLCRCACFLRPAFRSAEWKPADIRFPASESEQPDAPAATAERSTDGSITDHPRYSPQVVHHGDDLSLVAYPVQRIVNGGSTPLVLRISVESAEPGESVAIEHADGGEIRNIRVHHMAWDREKMMDKTIQMEQGEFDYEK